MKLNMKNLMRMGMGIMLLVAGSIYAQVQIHADEQSSRGRSGGLDQGGDVCATARVISSIPFCDTGTTVGYGDDYTPPCTDSNAPDVVYAYTPAVTEVISVSLCGSTYNTALIVTRRCLPGGDILCCSDNVCGMNACCSAITITPGATYYFIVDGGIAPPSAGNYLINVVYGNACPSDDCQQDTCNYPSRDLEPINNTCATGIPIVFCGDTLCGEISPATDRDWYLFQITGVDCQEVAIDVFGNDTPGYFPFGRGLNPKVSLFRADCITGLASDNSSGVGNDPRIDSLCLQPGIYFIQVENDSTNPGPYVLAIGCRPCQCACVVECPVGGIPEGEPCPNFPDNFNGGCNSSTQTFSPIQCGQTICGTSMVNPSVGRDTDWYELDLTSRDSIIWCVEAEFTVEVMIMRPGAAGCADRDTLARVIYPPCSLACVAACLDPGSYALYVAPAVAAALPCSDYVARLICLPCAEQDTCPFPSQDNEPINNVCGTVNPFIQCGDTLCGSIQAVTDQDWYNISLPPGGCYRLAIDVFGNDTPGLYPFGRGLNSLVQLWMLDCSTMVAQDINSGVGEDPRLVTGCLPSGVYSIRVRPEMNTSGPYILAVHCVTCACPDTCPYPDLDIEFNNVCGDANPTIACPDTVCGTISDPSDVDYFEFRIAQGCAVVTIDIFGNDTPGLFPFGRGLDPYVCLYDQNCTTTYGCDDSSGVGNDAHLVSQCLPAGVYSILVGPQNFASSGPYILTLSCLQCQCPETCHVGCNGTSEGEPCPNFPDHFNGGCDSDPFSARGVSCGETICGTATAQGGMRDTDWWIFSATEPDTFWWCVTAEFPVEVAIFAPGPGVQPCIGLDTLACATADSCNMVCVGACVPPGRYLLYVAPSVFNGVACRDYRATLVCTICSPAPCPAPDSVVIHYPDPTLDDLELHWPPVAGVDEYRIYRANTPDVPQIPLNFVASTTDTFYVDTGILGTAAEKHFYVVVGNCLRHGCR